MTFFRSRTATGSELFSILPCNDNTTFIFLRIFSLLETISLKTSCRDMRNVHFRFPSVPSHPRYNLSIMVLRLGLGLDTLTLGLNRATRLSCNTRRNGLGWKEDLIL